MVTGEHHDEAMLDPEPESHPYPLMLFCKITERLLNIMGIALQVSHELAQGSLQHPSDVAPYHPCFTDEETEAE